MQKAKDDIEQWLVKTIIGLNLCPFAKTPYENGQIKVAISKAYDFEQAYQNFIEELDFLNNDQKIRTTLLAFENLECDFTHFNDFVGTIEETLRENNLSDVFQLVAFHPHFVFKDADPKDLANYVNRSPYPLIHLLWSEDISQAVKNITTGENISLINEQTIKALSSEKLKEYFWFLD